ncbi:MAG: hypothetical protein ACRC46_12715 [Thermoguttaceae bacterium]
MPEITQKNFRALLPCKIAAVVEKIRDEKKLSSKEALLVFYDSDVYRELEIEETKCWWESPAQLYRDLVLP